MSLHDTQRLEIPHETIADIAATDPIGVYTHRQAACHCDACQIRREEDAAEDEGHRRLDPSTVAWTDAQGKRHELQWTARGLEALLVDVLAGGGL